jgi:DNA repair exonuclease SbcCD ATPase subunit
MIPLRVYLKNFLCHAEQEFRFEYHPVWLLHGPNGVGKSAVFDAMVYALYGESRRSDSRRNAVVDVIRHGEQSMRVEFDFELSGQRHRVWRTRARSGQTKQGIHQWANGQWTPVRNITADRDLKEWIANTLDLTYDAFVSAVLLRQGAAETLIDADKEKRRELFRSFIDLEPYIRLHERVKLRRTELSADVRQLSARLSGMAVVTDEQIAEATGTEQTADQELQKARGAAIAARNVLGQARIWEQHTATRRRIQSDLDAAAGRACHAAELELQVGRLRELRVLVPGLRRVGELQRTLSTAEETLREHSEQQAAAAVQAEGLDRELTQSRLLKEGYREQVAGFDRQILLGEAEEKRLSAEINRAEQAAELHVNLATLKAKEFDADLDDRTRAAEQAVTQAQAAKDALPHLDLLVGHRSDYHQAAADGCTAADDARMALAEVGQLCEAETSALAELNSATARKQEGDQASAIAQDQHEKAVKRCGDFAATATKPVCSECLQPIDAQHASTEQAKLEQAAQVAEANLNTWRGEVVSRTSVADAAKDRHGRLESDRRAAEQRHNDAARTGVECRRRAAEVQRAFARALKSLGNLFSDQVAAIADAGFPTPDDVVTIRTTAENLANRVRTRDELLVLQRDRDQTARDIQLLEQSISAVGAPADVDVARAEREQIELNLVAFGTSRSTAEQARAAAESNERESLFQQQQLAIRITGIAGDVAREEAEARSAGKELAATIAALPEAHRATAMAVTAEELQALDGEYGRLENDKVEEQFAALAEDRALQADRERQLALVEEQVAQLPTDACRSVAEVEADVKSADTAIGEGEKVHEVARTLLRTLTGHRDQRRETELHLAAAERDHTLHDRLAGLLGQDGIQLDLVRGAEGRIIARANEILVRLSMGDLRFEPPDPESRRAFDLSVRRMDCPEPIAVGNLSGGQRFRVAVSLALAVCQGAGDGVRRLESVIIDEGFGSLDRDGRMAMIAELRDGQGLSSMFKRVLVVSHQEDFAAAFPVGYRLRSDGGATTVEPFGLC